MQLKVDNLKREWTLRHTRDYANIDFTHFFRCERIHERITRAARYEPR